MSEEDGEVRGYMASEEVQGYVQCNQCEYWGDMTGYIDPDSPKFVLFLCPICEAIEKVVNIF